MFRCPSQVLPLLMPVLLVGLATFSSRAGVVGNVYTEDFSTTTYRDPGATTLNWDTTSGSLQLFPFQPALLGQYNTTGSAQKVVISGDRAYLIDGPLGLLIFDISDVTNPTPIGSLPLSGEGFGIAVAGTRAFIAGGFSGLHIVNVGDPTAPTLLATYNTPGVAADVAISGPMAYVADGFAGLVIVDISSIAVPTLEGVINPGGFAYDVVVDGSRAYLAAGSVGLKIIDVEDPSSPTVLGTLNTAGETQGVSIDGTYCALADGPAGFHMVNVANPALPTIMSTVASPSALDVLIDGYMVFGTDGNQGLVIIEAYDANAMSTMHTYGLPGASESVVVSGALACVAAAEAGGLMLLQVGEVTLVERAQVNSGAHAPRVVSGRKMYAADEGNSRAYDVSDLSAPSLVGSGYGGHGVVPSGTRIYDTRDDTKIYDAANFALGQELGTIPGFGFALDINGPYLFVHKSTSPIMVFAYDVSDPANVITLGSVDSGVGINRPELEVDGNRIYQSSHGGVGIIDAGIPSGMTLMGFYRPNPLGSNFGRQFSRAGRHAFVALDAAVGIVNLSTPQNPTLAGTFVMPTGEAPAGMECVWPYVFATDSSGMTVIDVRSPSSPTEAFSFPGVGAWCTSMTAYGRYLFAHRLDESVVYQTLSRRWAWEGNVAQSTVLDPNLQFDIKAMRMSASAMDSISWRLSADGGLSWTLIVPGGPWVFPSPGDSPMWRAQLENTSTTADPTAYDLEIEWLAFGPQLSSIMDIPNDQGGRVRISMIRSGHDVLEESAFPATGYQLYRRVDPSSLLEATPAGASAEMVRAELGHALIPGLDYRLHEDRVYVSGGTSAAKAFPSGTWEAVAWVAATQSDEYLVPATTLADSSFAGPNWSIFMATVHTTNPQIWFPSLPDSAYSIDNIAPGVPANLTADYSASGVDLDWDDAPESDFQFYRIYRSEESDFVPGPSNLVHEVGESSWRDVVSSPWAFHYMLSAVDHAGNEGPATAPSTATDSPQSNPAAYLLGDATPNPFNPSTAIRFDIPRESHVQIAVYNVAGRVIRVLVDEVRTAGRHSAGWDGKDDAGRSVGSGVYVYRMQAGGHVSAKRMVLLK